ncbi:hypothetical protein CLV70_14019 [Pseudosporangium ferrugineum]|uniref:DUF2946 family protein n=1 Tax=Pseudosporangium ferrugineum TaxID=439699 RepID=A0A2T0RCY4_9ACTN|nr:hypothetical protein CLV70_14019 [Pseudosporangium ferrugineum]
MAAVGRTARLALLLATALGLALMHTLGHTGVRADPHPAMTGMSTTAATGAAGMLSAVVTAAQPCPDGHCDGHGGHGSGAWSACLAILAGLAVIVMLLRLLTAVRGHRLHPVPAVLRALSPRAPPDRPAGLTLASAAVQRI